VQSRGLSKREGLGERLKLLDEGEASTGSRAVQMGVKEIPALEGPECKIKGGVFVGRGAPSQRKMTKGRTPEKKGRKVEKGGRVT